MPLGLEMRSWALTGDDLDDSGFLHVGWKVASPHVLLHDADVGELLQRAQGVSTGTGTPSRDRGHSAGTGDTRHILHSQGSPVTWSKKSVHSHREPEATSLSWL